VRERSEKKEREKSPKGRKKGRKRRHEGDNKARSERMLQEVKQGRGRLQEVECWKQSTGREKT